VCRTPFHSGAVSWFFLPCIVKKRTAKIIYRALSDAARGKGVLPCKMLPCALCRALRRKTHGKEFAVRFRAFARGARQSRCFPLWYILTFREYMLCAVGYLSVLAIYEYMHYISCVKH
jgi:hypothetical protein